MPYGDTKKMKRRTSRDAPTGHKLFKFISFSFQSRRWAHIKRSVETPTMHTAIIISTCLAAIALGGCESAPQWTSGNYEVYSMGGLSELEFGVDVGGGIQGLVNPQVAGVGEDARWIVVKQHPNGDKTKTDYFYLPKRSSDEQKKGFDVVQGPFSETEFEQKSNDLKLPPFSRYF